MIFFREIDIPDAQMLMDWRLQPRIADWMLTKISNDINSQVEWIKRMRDSTDSYHWIIQYQDQDIGYAKCYDLDHSQKSAYTGFYIGDEKYTRLTFFCIRVFYAALFEKYSLNALKVLVFPENPAIILHDHAGHIYDENAKALKVNHPKKTLYPYILYKDTFMAKNPYTQVALLPETFRNL